jgi:hypothetical protein
MKHSVQGNKNKSQASDSVERSEEEVAPLVEVIEQYARDVRLTPDALLEHIRDLSDETTLGGPVCLLPEEVAQYCQTKTLPADREGHLMECEDCRAVVAASLPRPEHLEEFLAECRRSIQLQSATDD